MKQKTSVVWRPVIVAILVSLTLLAPTLLPRPTQAQDVKFHVPAGFIAETVVGKLRMPTSFAFAGAGRIFITEKGGVVRVVQDGQLLAEPFIDISAEVNEVGQRGLLDVAVHPNFPATPYVYLAYVYDPPEALSHNPEGARVSRILRLSANSANPNVHAPGSGMVILGTNSTFQYIGDPDRPEKNPLNCEDGNGGYIQDCLPNEGHVHPLAHMAFGGDGALYVASGDGLNYNFGSLRAQQLDSLAGKLLRINPLTGDGYANNPFYDGNPKSNRSKVYVYGMKHPFRFAIHPTTGELFIGDVGNLKWEEVTRARAGANLGWPCFEGKNPNAFDPICQPLLNGTQAVTHGFHVYPHEDGWGAVIGGDFYMGRAFPAYYRGAYFYGDFNKGTIQSVVFNGAGAPTYADFVTGIPGLVQISSGPDGAVYLLSVVNGALYRVRYTGGTTFAPSSSNSAGAANVPPPTPTPKIQPADGGTPSANPAPAGSGSGKILREWWSGISGKSIGDLTKSQAFGGKPTGSELISKLDAPRLFGSDYGTRLRGYLYPPTTGAYIFWIAADDSGELWLSTDANSANKKLIASVPEWTYAEKWDRFGAQQSQPIQLQAGQRYYLEVLHKQADQKDNLTVAWKIPGQERMVITGEYLSPPE